MSFSQPKLEDLAVPFTPELQHQHGLKISCLPYLISPVPLLKVKSFKLPGSQMYEHRSVKFVMVRTYLPLFAQICSCYPVLLPVYLIRYDWKLLFLKRSCLRV